MLNDKKFVLLVLLLLLIKDKILMVLFKKLQNKNSVLFPLTEQRIRAWLSDRSGRKT